MGANLALRDASRLLEQLTRASRDETGLVAGIGAFEQDMRDYVYPFMRMTMDHDRNFGGRRPRADGLAPGRDAAGSRSTTRRRATGLTAW